MPLARHALTKEQQEWLSVELAAKSNPLYARVQPALKPSSDLSFLMRASQIKSDDSKWDPEQIAASAMPMNSSALSHQPTSDALRRKSMIPNKKGGE